MIKNRQGKPHPSPERFRAAANGSPIPPRLVQLWTEPKEALRQLKSILNRDEEELNDYKETATAADKE